MIYEEELRIVRRLLDATRAGLIAWVKDEDGDWYTAEIYGRKISFRFLYFEAANQTGSDPQAIDLIMPGMNARFFFGTEGCSLMFELLDAAFGNWHRHNDRASAWSFLEEALSKQPPDRNV